MAIKNPWENDENNPYKLTSGSDPSGYPADSTVITRNQPPKAPSGYLADINSDFSSGANVGHGYFYDNPDMQAMREKQMDLSKGYEGSTLGAMREQARGEMAGQRQNALQSLAGKAARGGIGGARAAAMQGAADVGLQGKQAEMERKMALDQSQMVAQGTKSLQDFLMKQRFGELSTGLLYAQLGQAERGRQGAAVQSPGPTVAEQMQEYYSTHNSDGSIKKQPDDTGSVQG